MGHAVRSQKMRSWSYACVSRIGLPNFTLCRNVVDPCLSHDELMRLEIPHQDQHNHPSSIPTALMSVGVNHSPGQYFQTIEEALAEGPGKKDNLRRHATRLLHDLWFCGALQRGSKDQAARSIVKAVFQYSAIPMIDWEKVGPNATDLKDPSKARPEHSGRTRSRSPPGRSLRPLPRWPDQTPSTARSKSKSGPPAARFFFSYTRTFLLRKYAVPVQEDCRYTLF